MKFALEYNSIGVRRILDSDIYLVIALKTFDQSRYFNIVCENIGKVTMITHENKGSILRV